MDKKLEARIARLERLLLHEGKQVGTIYHICTLEDFLKYVVPKDQLSASGEYSNYLYGGDNYISFTRDKNYVIGHPYLTPHAFIRLVVDGDKLSNNYKIGPYNDAHWYRTEEDPYNGTAPVRDDDDDEIIKWREQEESVKGPIKNISKYLKSVQIDVNMLDQALLRKLKSLSRNSNLSRYNIVYCNFRKNKSNTLKNAIKQSGLKDGDDLAITVKCLSKAIKLDPEPLLFSGDINDVEQAVKMGADLDIEYKRGYPLTFYSKSDTVDILKYLLDHNADPNSGNDKDPAICRASDYDGSVNAVKLLLKYGADPNAQSKDGTTAFMSAALSGNVDSMKILLDAGADPYHVNKYGVSAFDLGRASNVKEFLSSLQQAT